MKSYRVIICYYDSGTRKEHDVEFLVDADCEEKALSKAKRDFNRYEHSGMGSWVRIIRHFRIVPLVSEDE